MTNLSGLLPIYERNSKIFNELFAAEESEFNFLDLKIEDLKEQFSINTATWGLNLFEKQLNIVTDLNKSYEERRSVITSKWRGTGKIDKGLIKLVVDSYTNGFVEVEFNENIKIIFNGEKGIPKNIESVYNSVDDIKPAHLNIIYEFAFILISEISAMTVSNLMQTKIEKFAFGKEDD